MNEKGTRVYVEIQFGVRPELQSRRLLCVCVCVCFFDVALWEKSKRDKIICSLLLNRKCFFLGRSCILSKVGGACAKPKVNLVNLIWKGRICYDFLERLKTVSKFVFPGLFLERLISQILLLLFLEFLNGCRLVGLSFSCWGNLTYKSEILYRWSDFGGFSFAREL